MSGHALWMQEYFADFSFSCFHWILHGKSRKCQIPIYSLTCIQRPSLGQTCIQRPSLGQRKNDQVRQVEVAGQSELSVLVLVHNDSHITVTGRKLFEKKITVAL